MPRGKLNSTTGEPTHCNEDPVQPKKKTKILKKNRILEPWASTRAEVLVTSLPLTGRVLVVEPLLPPDPTFSL